MFWCFTITSLAVIKAAHLHIHKEMDNGGVWGAEYESGL